MTSDPPGLESLSLVKQALLAVEQMKARLAAAEGRQREPIAVVGLGCRFPGQAGSPGAFWRLLAAGVNAVTPIPPDRWPVEAYYDPNPETPGKAYTRYGAFLEDIDKFDAQFFNLAPVEANSMDPQQRLLLEVSWEALEQAGLAGDGLRGSRTGVFVGVCGSDYMLYTLGGADARRVDAFSGTGSAGSITAGRLSYFYDLHGPNFPIDTACSSSLLAVHQAVQSLRQQECDLALAAGVSAMLSPELYVYFAKTHALSAGPEVRAFDARADGYVRGEGCGVMVLKRLSDALAAGDRLIAVVRGSAVNHDGRTSGLTAPNGPAQQSVIRAALANAGLSPAEVTYIETHGTGTPLGDPIEAQALAAAYRANDSTPLYLGGVKTNLGHLEGAAGIAGAIKAALMLEHRELVPHVNFELPSPHIAWSDLPLEVVTTHRPWPAGRPLRVGVSSFGFSGTNVHVILEAAPPAPERPAEAETAAYVLPLSARTAAALRQAAGRYAAHLRAHPTERLGDVAHTAGTGRAHFAHRLAVTGSSAAEWADRLVAFEQGEAKIAGLTAQQVRPHKPARLVFQFTGQGAQHVGMGRALESVAPRFREALAECDALLRPHLGVSIRAVMFGDAAAPTAPFPVALGETWLTQPALFAYEYALARQWQAWGLEPAAVIGHSIGEYVAACVAGALTLADALRLVAARGQLMQALPPEGAMVAAFAPEAQVAAVLAGRGDIDIAAVNGPDNVVISGTRTAVRAAAEALEAQGVLTQALRVSHAFHSPLMEPMLAEFRRVAGGVRYAAPQLPLVSNVTGRLFGRDDLPEADYWTSHVRGTVRYYAGLQTLTVAGYGVFLEVGPSTVLTDLGRRYLPEAAAWVAGCRPNQEPGALAEALGALYAHGQPVNWAAVYPRGRYHPVPLPTYPFERKRFWLDGPARPLPAADSRRPEGEPPVINDFVDVLV
ncbi:MAG: type I polyketide synthase [Anaerolineales bacterium]|nr:type I polyketide synthase [Anaerolineales bacterium]